MNGAEIAGGRGEEPDSIPDLLRVAADRWGSRTAVSFPDGSLSYSELYEGASRRTMQLTGLGIQPGEHVALLVPDGPRGFEALCGCWLAGAVPVPLHTRSRANELQYLVEHSDAVALVLGDARSDRPVDLGHRIEQAFPEIQSADGSQRLELREAPRLRFVIPEEKRGRPWQAGDYDFAGRGTSADTLVTASDPALILYTSGTTSRPKGCVLTHGRLMAVAREATGRLGFSSDDVVWSPTPSFHIAAYICLLGTVASGAEYVGASHFEPEQAWEQLRERSVTVAYAVFPPLYLDVAELDSYYPDALPTLRALTTAAAPAEIEQIRRAFPQATQISVYGSTETSGTVALNHLDDDAGARLTTCGRPTAAAEIVVGDPDSGEVLPVGEEGEIWVRGPLLSHYHRDPDPVTDDDGWLHTGDLGAFDEQGRLGFRGRLKDMLKVGGENVSPSEIEDFLMHNPQVKLAQVVGVPDRRLGEVPAAFVELVAEATVENVELIEYCRARIAGYRVPRYIRIVTEWPRSATKIRKPVLRERLIEELEAAGSSSSESRT